MKETIFDLLEPEIGEGKKGYLDLASNAPQPKDDSFLNSVKEYGKIFLKGTVEGASRFGRAFGPLIDESGRSNEEIFREQTENLNEFLPTENESFGQKALRRGLQIAPTALSSPGATFSALPRSVVAGFLGEGAKELGLPEWAQSAAEITAFLSPSIAKKLLSEGNEKAIIDAGKKLGLSDEQITPLIQSEFKQKWLTKLSPKRGQTKRTLSSSKNALDEAYGQIQMSENAKKAINPTDLSDFFSDIEEFGEKMPFSVRSKIKNDLKDFKNSSKTGSDLINLYADINHELGDNAKQLSLFKKPIRDQLHKISPELGTDFDSVNKLYAKYFDIASKLKPTIASDIVSSAHTIGTLGSLITGNYPFLVHTVGAHAAKEVARQMLLNPRLQQLSRKIVNSLNNNKFIHVKKLSDLLSVEMKKISPEISEELKNLTEEEIYDFLKTR